MGKKEEILGEAKMEKVLSPLNIPGVIYKLQIRETDKGVFIDMLLKGSIESSFELTENTKEGVEAAIKKLFVNAGIAHQLPKLTQEKVINELFEKIQTSTIIEEGQFFSSISYEKSKMQAFVDQVNTIESKLDDIEHRIKFAEERLGL